MIDIKDAKQYTQVSTTVLSKSGIPIDTLASSADEKRTMTASQMAESSGNKKKEDVKVSQFPASIGKNLSITFMAKDLDIMGDADAQKEELTRKASSDENAYKKITLADSMLRKSHSVATITLPLPNSFNESTRHSWGQQTGIMEDIVGAGLSALSGKYGSGVVSGVLKAAGQTQANIGARAPATDPAFFQKYTGTEPRAFSFSWDFVITSPDDKIRLTEIFKLFKTFSAPDNIISNVALLAPNYWIVRIENIYLEDSLRLQPMVITSVEIDYAASGMMDVYHDGTPKFMKLSISCVEISAMTRQVYGAENIVVAGAQSVWDSVKNVV